MADITIAELFDKTADEIEARGGYVVHTFDDIGGLDLGDLAYEFLCNWLGVPGIASWEDAHSVSEIVAKLRQAAGAARGVDRLSRYEP